MKGKRIRQVIKYGWKDAGEISKYPDVRKSRISIFLDILHCFREYYLFSYQYKNNRIWEKPESDRPTLVDIIGRSNMERDGWIDDYYENRKFLNKYTSRKYETSPKQMKKRRDAYTKRYGLGENCTIQFNVEFSREHQLNGTLKVGNNILFAKNVFVDYSGDVEIYDGVKMANGVVIESHTHSLYKTDGSAKKGHLVIEEGVKILSRAYIADTCHRIGRHARIGAQSCVRNNIPPYAIVMGNPAKIVGFIYTPEEMQKYEEEIYSEDNRTQIESYTRDFNRYYKDNAKELAQLIKLKA